MKKIMEKIGVFLYILGASSLYGTTAPVLTAYLGGVSGSPFSVTAVNVPFSTAVASISTGNSTSGNDSYVAIAPDGSKVCYALSRTGGTTIGVIDPSTYAYTSVSGFNDPAGLAITPDSQYAYVPNKGTNTVSVLRLSDNTIVRTVTVGAAPTSVAFLPDGSAAYVVNSTDITLSVINTVDYSVTGPYALTDMGGANQIAINPVLLSGVRYAYITGGNPGSTNKTVGVFNVTTNTMTSSTVTLPNDSRRVAVTPNGATVCVTRGGSPGLSFIDTGTLAVTSATGSFSAGFGVAVTPDGASAYVAGLSNIGIFNIGTAALTSTITTNIPSGSFKGLALGYTAPLADGLLTGTGINLSTAASAVTATITNGTSATIYVTLAAYQVTTLPPASGWVSTQTALGTPSRKTIVPGATNSSFRINTTTGFSGYVQFDLYQTSNQVNLSTITDPDVGTNELNIYSAYIIQY